MSTRCQLLFRSIYTFPDKQTGEIREKVSEAQIYQHSDGYPSAVIPDLYRFYKWNTGRNDEPSYAAANYIYYQKRLWEAQYNVDFMDNDKNSVVKIGYGVQKADHTIYGEEDYLYRITMHDDHSPTNKSGWIVEIAQVDGDTTTFDNAMYYIRETLDQLNIDKIFNMRDD